MPSRSQVRVAVDATGEVESAQDYYAYGEILRGYAAGSGNDDRYKFTEKERDAESEYDYFGARYYDSELGRWLSVDPMSDNYPGWSPYVYCLNNPLKFIDKNGKEPGLYSSYIQNQYNSLWNTGSQIANDFTYKTLPVALDYVAFGTAFWLPQVSLAASGASMFLTVTRDIKEGVPSTDSFVSTVTTAAGASKNRAVAGTAAAIQIIYDTMKDDQTNDNKNSMSKEKQKEKDEKTKKALNAIKKKNEEPKRVEEQEKQYFPISTYRYNNE